MKRGPFSGFPPPTRRIALRAGALELEVWPQLGAAIAAFAFHAADGQRTALFREVLPGTAYTPIDHLSSWPLVPYSNRIRGGRFVHQGREYVLPPNYAGFAHPLHGVGWLRAWRELELDARQCTLELRHLPDEDWPFAFTAVQRLSLEGHALHSSLTLRNTSDQMMPCGLGQHPYVCCPRGTRLKADVRGVWMNDEETLPREYLPVPPHWTMRSGWLLDDLSVDNCFDGLHDPVELQWPDGSSLAISSSQEMQFLIVYHPVEGKFVCLEPVTHRPDAFNPPGSAEGNGLLVLEPGATLCVTHCYTYQPATSRKMGAP